MCRRLDTIFLNWKRRVIIFFIGFCCFWNRKILYLQFGVQKMSFCHKNAEYWVWEGVFFWEPKINMSQMNFLDSRDLKNSMIPSVSWIPAEFWLNFNQSAELQLAADFQLNFSSSKLNVSVANNQLPSWNAKKYSNTISSITFSTRLFYYYGIATATIILNCRKNWLVKHLKIQIKIL